MNLHQYTIQMNKTFNNLTLYYTLFCIARTRRHQLLLSELLALKKITR